MEINRRRLLASIVSLPLSTFPEFSQARSKASYVTTARVGNKKYSAFILDDTGEVLQEIKMTGRGHGAGYSRQRSLTVVFARRPGNFAMALDITGQSQPYIFTTPKNRHFFGHGIFDKSGRYLYATENDFDAETGVLGIYDAANSFQRIGQIKSGGIGPHEVILSHDGSTLIIANGGILTHPDYPREKLNLAEMSPNITLINVETGRILKSLFLPPSLHQVSLRHLAEDIKGNIWIGGQYQGAKTDDVPLLFKAGKNDAALTPLLDTRTMAQNFKHYIGSVAINQDGTRIAFSAPRANLISIWDSRSLMFIRNIHHRDACGVARHGSNFMATAGDGTLLKHDKSIAFKGISWDNHLVPL